MDKRLWRRGRGQWIRNYDVWT